MKVVAAAGSICARLRRVNYQAVVDSVDSREEYE
jgi:hypothetical protein